MAFRQRARKKAVVVSGRIGAAGDESESDSEGLGVPLAKAPARRGAMTTSWEMMDGDDEVITTKPKKKRVVAPPPRLLDSQTKPEDSVGTAASYSTEALAALREAQPTKVEFKPRGNVPSLKEPEHESPTNGMLIPDEREISKAKASREAKRLRLSSSTASAQSATNSLEKDYMALDVTDKKKDKESRLVREDDDDEGDGTETFEDYEGARIAFGGNTAKKAQDKRRVAFSLDLEMAQTEEHTASIPGQVPEKTEDDELLAWEESRIRQGQGLNPTLVSLRKEEGAVVPDFSLPQPGPLPEFTDILSLQTSLTAELDTQVQSERQLSEQLVRDGVELENNLAAITPNMAQVSKHYDFYQELKEFVYNHADFLQAKDAELVKFENMKKGILLRKSRIEGDQIKELLSTLLSELSDWNGAAHATVALRPVDSEDILDDEVDLEDSQSHFFDDIEDAHSSIIALKQTFESWTARFPTDYENCYGTLSLPGVFDIHVRMELLLWDPFHSKTDLEAYQWHSLLMNYGNEPEPLLITKLVTRCCFPLLTSYTDALQVTSLNHSKNLSYALNQLLDYVDSSSAPFQTLLVEIEKRIQASLLDLVQAYSISSLTFKGHMSPLRDQWINFMVEVIQSLLVWKRWFPKPLMIEWVCCMTLDQLVLPMMSAFPTSPSDIVIFEKLVNLIPPDWIESGFRAPPFLKAIENGILKYALSLQSSASPERNNLEKVATLLVRIQSLDAASQWAKRWSL